MNAKTKKLNSQEKSAIMRDNGYRYECAEPSGYNWYNGDSFICFGENFAKAAHAAYQHYLDNQAPAETQASETPAAPQVEAVSDEQSEDYHVIFVTDADYNFALVADDGEVIDFEYYDEKPLQEKADLLNQELAPKKNRIAKLEADLATERSYGELARNHADKLTARINELEADNAALRNENARMLKFTQDFANESLPIINAVFWQQTATALLQDRPPTPPAQEAPKRPVATQCRVNWNGRGFSTGSYEVLGYSQEKQVYVLNISSDDNKPMPKTVKMADCAVVS